jgi:hypothetical protein
MPPHATHDSHHVYGAFGRFVMEYRCEPVVIQVFSKGEPLVDGLENHHCPCVDIEAQVLLMVVGERLIFVLGQRGGSPTITHQTI